MSRKHIVIVGAGSLLLALVMSDACFASTSGGGNLPWESPLQQIQQSITGPVAGFIALAAVAVAGGMLIFGGELNDFARRLMYVVLVAGILLGATQIVALFGASGASIGDVARTAPSTDRAGNPNHG
ncbi:type IV secretory pathway VirB2 component (pilin) [Bradyrhizobium sp. USDA 4524]|uniref:TrbC/VirB2 family protein n=1 Tax=unclassified Bradyrhizobium TaxID=2631580 RepID=UPI00209FCD9F|nr:MULTISPECIES: TrbC/VirB2 family protein [unclassified Bradyrhizobium]MCP1845850.1 type IV secretion system protein VirB2 [Bradyrhizobium sp. USDA 4538]MCP1907516.1 type IV secretion system protein VirB2 [Bradyrhizobium sp. USDA 4537]MCP1985302.1 type IV secretion system protein VirB2 [Bradyrhizobium sp. USDA 4539]